MIRVIDSNGGIHEFSDGDFHTEELTNNLVIETDESYAVFADGKWIAVEKRRG